MQWRAPLLINSNVVGYLIDNHRIKADQAWSTACVTLGAVLFHMQLEAGEVAIDMQRDTPQCMNTYNSMFNSTRVPGAGGQDALVKVGDMIE